MDLFYTGTASVVTLIMAVLQGWQADLFQDRVFTHSDWTNQRSYKRLMPNIPSCTCLRVVSLSPVLFAVVYVVAIAVFVAYFGAAYQNQLVVNGFSLTEAYSYTSFALSLLLVFRTNSSYSRWWEARKIWGRVFDLSRHLTRLVLTWWPDTEQEAKGALLRWVKACPYILHAHIADLKDMTHIEVRLGEPEFWYLQQSQHRPLAAGCRMSQLLQLARLSDYKEVQMENHVQAFVNCCGGCERIFKTPIPLAYTRHTSRYLMIWITFLPLALYPHHGWMTILSAPLIAFLLLGLENIGIQIEEPFRVLAIKAFCAAIEGNIEDMIHAKQYIPPASKPESMMCTTAHTIPQTLPSPIDFDRKETCV